MEHFAAYGTSPRILSCKTSKQINFFCKQTAINIFYSTESLYTIRLVVVFFSLMAWHEAMKKILCSAHFYFPFTLELLTFDFIIFYFQEIFFKMPK